MSQAKVRAALEIQLGDWADENDLKVAFEDVGFVPVEGTPYLRFNLLPAETISQDLGGDLRAWSGVAQISVFVPSGKGPGAAEAYLAQLDGVFPCGDSVSGDGLDVVVLTPVSAGPFIEDEAFSMLPVSFRYRADLLITN